MVNKGYAKYPSLSALPKEVLEDTLCLVAQGKTNCFKYMASDLEISRNAIDRYKKGEVNNIEHTEAQMFKLKMDIIHFAESDIVEQYIESKSLSLEEKFDFVCQIFSAIIENQKNGRQPNGGMGGGATGQNVSKIFSSFGFLFEHIMNYSYDAPEDNGKTENTGSTHLRAPTIF
jgi:hypothetical protein